MKYVVDFRIDGIVSVVVDSENMANAVDIASQILKDKINGDEFTPSISAFSHEDTRRIVQ